MNYPEDHLVGHVDPSIMRAGPPGVSRGQRFKLAPLLAAAEEGVACGAQWLRKLRWLPQERLAGRLECCEQNIFVRLHRA